MLLHTVIDWMRTEDEEGEGRAINHHGKSITVGGKQDIDTVPLFDAVKFEILLPSVQISNYQLQMDEAQVKSFIHSQVAATPVQHESFLHLFVCLFVCLLVCCLW